MSGQWQELQSSEIYCLDYLVCLHEIIMLFNMNDPKQNLNGSISTGVNGVVLVGARSQLQHFEIQILNTR